MSIPSSETTPGSATRPGSEVAQVSPAPSASFELLAVTIDCSDAKALAQFYADLTGGEVSGYYPEHGFAQVKIAGQTLEFQEVQGFSAPEWPSQDRPQQVHLDFRVSEVAAAQAHAQALGAREADEQPVGESFLVMLDPDGHPFCLCPPSES